MKHKSYLLVIVILILSVVSGINFINNSLVYNLPITFSSIVSHFGVFIGSSVAGLILVITAFGILSFVDKNSVMTKFQLFGIRISERIRTKNINTIYPPLLSFFYLVLERNNEFLKLPLGNDYSALIPNGFRPIYRQNSVFYIFQLVMPFKPDYDEKTLKQLVQSYIDSELINYGIAGLKSCFNSRVYGVVPSVYVDRAYYNESQHMLNFAVIYACTEDDACYIIKAKQRDKEEAQVEKSVYDDEL